MARYQALRPGPGPAYSGTMAYLGVNVDHVATVRQARYRDATPGLNPEPEPLEAARVSVRAGARGITVHIREDRRHIQDRDVSGIRKDLKTVLNLEMAVTPAMVRVALKLHPEETCLVPENRREVTTEGGLEVVGQYAKIRRVTQALRKAGIRVSHFIDPELDQVHAAWRAGAHDVELHTGAYANALGIKARKNEIRRHQRAAELAHRLGLRVNAGHGLNYENTVPFLQAVPHLHTLNIGHAIISRALFTGLNRAVRDMVKLIRSVP